MTLNEPFLLRHTPLKKSKWFPKDPILGMATKRVMNGREILGCCYGM